MIPSPKTFKSRLRRPALAALAALIPLAGNAATIYGETSDTSVRSDGYISPVDGTSMLPGTSGADPVMDRSAVYVFRLPDLGMVADPFTTATFRFNLAGTTNTPPNVDLYGLGRRTAATVLAGDYYGETTTVDPTDATFLQNNILISSTPVGLVTSNSGGGTALKTYLNTQYAGGAGAGTYVFLRLSTDGASTAVRRYAVTAADGATPGPPDTRPQISYNLPTGYDRPFIWVRDSEKAGILDKIANHAWATSVYGGMVSRVAADVASHQADRDTFLRQLPVDWTLATAKFKTIPAYAESSVRYPAEAKFNDGLDCAVLYYLTGDVNYASCAADILHNAVKTLLPVAPSTSVGNGGWIFQDDFLKEARVTGTQLPIIYDFLYSYLQSNQVYDVQTAAMVNFNFTGAQSVFRTLYQLARDHGSKENNWAALMSTCMLNSLLALDDAAERAAALQVYLVTGSSRQASLQYDYRVYTQPGDLWPESLQYAGAVGSIRTSHMVLLERVDPGLSLFDTYPNLPLSLPRVSYLRYPNGEQVSFGDGHREAGGQPFSQYELVYQHALARGRTGLTSFFGSLINGGVASDQYHRASLRAYEPLGQHNEPLQLLWQAPEIAEPGVSPELPRTDTLPFAGMALQRNPAPVANPTYGLMCFVGGAGHVHSHASGMSMELFGMGQVMGAKSGRDEYGSALHENYYRLFASNNTVIVNGASRGQGGWSDIAINTVQTVAMEPQPFAPAVSADFSFTCSSFADDKGTLAEGTQQRTMAIVRTSPTSGFYVDVFRSKSSVTNRTATTLNGPVTNQYHDYIYRDIGETTVDLSADGAALPLVSQSNRFQNDIGDAYDQPGWRYFTNTEVSYPNSQAVRARFVATVSGTARHMDMHLPAVASREYARVDSPPIVDAPSPYNTRVAPALVVRQIGEAWNKAFAVVYEPHFESTGGTVRNVTKIEQSGVVVGVKIESTVAGRMVTHYVLSNPNGGDTYTDSAIGLSFTGRFGVVADNGDNSVSLYLGQGRSLSYRGNSVTTVSGTDSQAEVRFAPCQAPLITANAPVTAVAASPDPDAVADGTWLGNSGNWSDPAVSGGVWSCGIIANGAGYTADFTGVDISADRTITLDAARTIGNIIFTDTTTPSHNLTISGPNPLTLECASGSPVIDVTQAGRTLTIGSVVAGTGGLTKSGAGTLALTGENILAGPIAVDAGILALSPAAALAMGNPFTGAGTLGINPAAATNLQLTGSLSGFSGTINVAGNTGSAKLATGTAALGPGAVVNVASDATWFMGAATQAGITVNLHGTGNAESLGALRLDGGTISSTSAVVLKAAGAVGANSGTGTIHAVISEDGGSFPLTKMGAGTIVLGANNTYTGGTIVGKGTLALGTGAALAKTSGITLTGGTTLRPDVVGAVISAPITVGDSGTTVTITAPSIVGGGGSSAVPLTLGGAIGGAGNVTFSGIQNNNAYGTIILAAAGTYEGSTLVTCTGGTNTEIFIKLGIDNALPATTVLTLDGGNGAGSGRYCDLNLNGHHQTLGGLTSVTGRTLRTQRVNNTSTTPATLTIDDTGNRTFAGQLGGGGANFGLTKSGSGTFTVTGSRSYQGNTTVTGGTLSLGTANAQDDPATVTLAASGARLQLTFAGTDTVGRLVIGTTQQPAGIYGHTDSGATNGRLGVGALDDFFEPGTGTLTVTDGYRTWAATNAKTDTPADDYDGDGVRNAVEYVLGGGKDTNDLAKLPKVSNTGGSLVFTFTRDQAAIDGSTAVAIEVGTTLATWPDSYAVPDAAVASDPGVSVVKGTPDGFDTVTLTLPMSADEKKFARLKVTVP